MNALSAIERLGRRTTSLCALVGLLAAAPVVSQSQEKATRPSEQRRVVVVRAGSGDGEAGSGHEQTFEYRTDDSAEGEHLQIRRKVTVVPSEGGDAEEVLVVRLDTVSGGDELDAHSNRWILDALDEPAYLGVEVLPMTDALRRYFGVPAGVGVLVSQVVEGSPAFRIGLRAGDVLASVDGEEVPTSHRLRTSLAKAGAEDVVDLEIWRSGHVLHRSVQLEERAHRVVELRGDGRQFLHVEANAAFEWTEDGVTEVDLDREGVAVEVREFLRSGDWKTEIHRLQQIDVEALELRIRELELQIQKLEQQLAEPR